MKKIFAKLLAMFVVVALACSLMACMPQAQEGTKNITVVVDMSAFEGEIQPSEGIAEYTDKKKTFEIKTDAKYLEDVLDELSVDKKLEFSGSQSATGLFITEIDNVSAVYAEGYWLSVYCNDSDEEIVDTSSEWIQPYDFGDKKLYPSNWGITTLPVKDGLVYALVLVKA